MQGHLHDGETVLIHAGGSGVGTAAVQLVKLTARNVTTIITAGSEKKINVALSLGAMAGFNYHDGNFAEKVLSVTDGELPKKW